MSNSHKAFVDMHVHLGLSPDGGNMTWERFQRFFKGLPITHAVMFPIDEKNPGPSYQRINDRIAAIVRKHRNVLGFCRLNPREEDAAYREFKRCMKLGFRGVKLHPRSERFAPYEAEDLISAVEKEKVPVLIHTSHEHHCHPLTWEAIFSRHKKMYFILGHAGKDAYREAALVAQHCPNVFLDTSTLSFHRTAYLFRTVGAAKIVFASDAPYSHPRIEIMKYDMILGDHKEARRRIYQENPKKVLGGLP